MDRQSTAKLWELAPSKISGHTVYYIVCVCLLLKIQLEFWSGMPLLQYILLRNDIPVVTGANPGGVDRVATHHPSLVLLCNVV